MTYTFISKYILGYFFTGIIEKTFKNASRNESRDKQRKEESGKRFIAPDGPFRPSTPRSEIASAEVVGAKGASPADIGSAMRIDSPKVEMILLGSNGWLMIESGI